MNVRGFEDYAGRELRLTDERLDHIERRPEMVDQLDRIAEVLLDPALVAFRRARLGTVRSSA